MNTFRWVPYEPKTKLILLIEYKKGIAITRLDQSEVIELKTSLPLEGTTSLLRSLKTSY